MGLLEGLQEQALSMIAGKSPEAAKAVQNLLQQNGGVQGLVKNFQEKGFSDITKSWVGTGANLPISGEQISQVLGNEKVKELATQFGTTPEAAAAKLAEYLPMVVDKLTPNGNVEGGGVMDMAKGILGGFMGGSKAVLFALITVSLLAAPTFAKDKSDKAETEVSQKSDKEMSKEEKKAAKKAEKEAKKAEKKAEKEAKRAEKAAKKDSTELSQKSENKEMTKEEKKAAKKAEKEAKKAAKKSENDAKEAVAVKEAAVKEAAVKEVAAKEVVKEKSQKHVSEKKEHAKQAVTDLAPGEIINVNKASAEELARLPGIGEKKAELIIKNRPFKTADDILKINGIGEATMSQIKSHISF